jgi:AraC-like DNA-binding protein
MDLIWHEDGFLVAGPDRRAQFSDLATDRNLTAVRFAPGLGPAFFGLDASDLVDERIPLDRLWPDRHVRHLVTGAEEDAVTALVAAVRLRLAGKDLPGVPVLVRMLAAGRPVAETARAVGWSERRLHRYAERTFGYGPKTLTRVLRFRRAVECARAGTGFAQTAVVCGYSDQAHLARDVRALSGTTLRALLGTEGSQTGRAANRSMVWPSGSSSRA